MVEQTKRSFLEVVAPVADYQDLGQPDSRPAPRPSSIKGKTVALLPSEKSSSPPFIKILAQRLTAETDVKGAFMHNPDWPFFHPERAGNIATELNKLAQECDMVISGVAY